ncbi:hypothetical protein JB92DRAFT_3144850 [Gautieria morchelliformis]|nr:hypothetical protein JB92DRAFT_3144850 [Gautieria morchelliformis]
MEDGPGVGLERERTSGIRTHLPLTEFSSPGVSQPVVLHAGLEKIANVISTSAELYKHVLSHSHLHHQTNLSPSSPSSLPIPTSGEKQMSSSSCSYSSEQVENLMKALASKGLGPDDIIKSLSNGSGTSPRASAKAGLSSPPDDSTFTDRSFSELIPSLRQSSSSNPHFKPICVPPPHITIQKVPKASSSTALSAPAVRKSKRQDIPASARYHD